MRNKKTRKNRNGGTPSSDEEHDIEKGPKRIVVEYIKELPIDREKIEETRSIHNKKLKAHNLKKLSHLTADKFFLGPNPEERERIRNKRQSKRESKERRGMALEDTKDDADWNSEFKIFGSNDVARGISRKRRKTKKTSKKHKRVTRKQRK